VFSMSLFAYDTTTTRIYAVMACLYNMFDELRGHEVLHHM
jgi:hypothetical protein